MQARQDDSDSFTPTDGEHLGYAEGIPIKSFSIKYWWKPGERIDLGDRELEVIHTPGHAKDSITLLDKKSNQLFTGDFIYPAELFAMLPDSDPEKYVQSTEMLLNKIDKNTILLGAHRSFSKSLKAPRQTYQDMLDLKNALLRIREGDIQSTGFYPRFFKVNDSMELWADIQPF